MNKLKYLLALNSVFGLGPVRLKLLLDYFEEPQKVWEAQRSQWEDLRVPKHIIESWLTTKQDLDPNSLLEKLQKDKIEALSIYDEDYPSLLKQIHDYPLIIYFRGNKNLFNSICIGVVGTRKITGYGKLVTEKFVKVLSSSGITIVSGLAKGVDSCAHQTTLDNKGKTIAVLGGGLNKIFPAENVSLAKSIWENGGIVASEFLPDLESLPGNFPARNRIISGLSKAVLITEAALESGSLITAKLALDQNRDVYAVPGPITSDQSQGTLSLIKEGARLVTDPQEILEEMGLSSNIIKNKSRNENLKLTDNEKTIISCLINENKHIDEIIRETKISAAIVSAILVKMEILGLVRNLGGGVYLKI